MADMCRRCSAALPDSARFCANCGSPVEAAAVAPLDRPKIPGERKPVTALFADVVGSVTLAETMDPEDWSVLMSGALGRMETAVRRFDGTIAKLLGDGVLALFGAETSHEDDPERAIRAAVEMLESFDALGREIAARGGREFAIRIGINTGLALVGTVAASGPGDRSDISAYGDTVNVASRLQSAAEPGHALLTDATWRLVAHVAEARDLGDLTVKGRAEPVHAYGLLGLRVTPASPRGLTGIHSPIVGRDVPLERLRVALAQAASSGSADGVVVVGEPGIGKSRLLAEFRSEVEATPTGWVEGHARSYGQTSPDHLLIDLVHGLSVLVAESGEPPDPVVAHLVGLPTDATIAADLERQTPEVRRARYLEAVRNLLREGAANRPLVVVLEDLHWADASSVDALIQLLPVIVARPILVLATTRPDREAHGWRLVEAARTQLGTDRLGEIALGPLTDDDTRTLVSNLLEIDALPIAVRDRILAHADGNPFFVEETLRMFMDRGVIVAHDGRWSATDAIARVEIPETVHGLLLARIDRLPAGARRALRVGSVIGREFAAGVLRDVQRRAGDRPATDDDLTSLQETGLVRTRSDGPQTVLRFRHALVQEAAYDSLLRAERVGLHRAVGETLEHGADAQALDDLAPIISEHFEAAGERPQALAYARRAAEAAFARYALPEAIAQYRRAIHLADEPGAAAPEIQHLWLRAGRAIELMDRYADATEHYTGMLNRSREVGNRAMELAALTARSIGEGMAISSGADAKVAERDALDALALARELGDPAAEATVLWALLLVNRFGNGDAALGIRFGLESIALADELGLERQAALSRQDVARSYQAGGILAEAVALLDKSIPYWRRVGELPSLADGLRLRGGVRMLMGEFAAALVDIEEAWLLDETTGNIWGRGFGRLQRGAVRAELGQLEAAVADLRAAVALALTTDISLLRLASQSGLAAALIEEGRLEEARPIQAAAMKVAAERLPWSLPASLGVQAWLEVASGNLEAARVAAQGVGGYDATLFSFGGMRFWAGPIETELALGDPAAARARVEPILAAAVRSGARAWEPQARLLLARALLALGDAASAERELRHALAISEAIGQGWNRDKIVATLKDIAAPAS